MPHTIFIIQICPEACDSFIHPKAFTTLEDAQEAIRKESNYPEQKQDSIFRDKDYTYYYIEKVTVTI